MRYNVAMTDVPGTLRVHESSAAEAATRVFVVAGELDLATIAVLKDVVGGAQRDDVQRGKPRPVVLDLADMTFCDSTGLGSFVALHRAAIAAGTVLSLAAPRKRVADLLRISGIDQVIPIHDSVTAAL